MHNNTENTFLNEGKVAEKLRNMTRSLFFCRIRQLKCRTGPKSGRRPFGKKIPDSCDFLPCPACLPPTPSYTQKFLRATKVNFVAWRHFDPRHGGSGRKLAGAYAFLPNQASFCRKVLSMLAFFWRTGYNSCRVRLIFTKRPIFSPDEKE